MGQVSGDSVVAHLSGELFGEGGKQTREWELAGSSLSRSARGSLSIAGQTAGMATLIRSIREHRRPSSNYRRALMFRLVYLSCLFSC